ncbi:MAG: hypothetical protein A2X28_04910 [Elusimicrobia bacterium GWA2_56_46]|nr:MAG: hypothetical protein A2X28_04910 [Elusimicrobia bacterium GWA2_56_46]OGR56212.1 MAG: hypothetical protein A2X39_08330 [Elusimicrobia bacterium GWC2_56_31]HBB66959.1 hypothetical protein [Elusimicrobiota bacterium]HBW23011.1 hypothetical protein [Elusimicrobiota bacterium]
MSENTNEMLNRVAVAGLRKCVEKLSRVSAGTWKVAGADVSMGTLDEAVKLRAPEEGEAAAVYFDVKGELPFIAILLFDPRDIDRISRCFLGYSFSASPRLNQAGELLLTELGNIILNSLAGAFSNAVKRIFIPSAPRCLRGEPQHLLGAMGASVDVKQSYRIISVKLDIQCDKSVTRCEVLGLIPEKLAQELLNSGGVS